MCSLSLPHSTLSSPPLFLIIVKALSIWHFHSLWRTENRSCSLPNACIVPCPLPFFSTLCAAEMPPKPHTGSWCQRKRLHKFWRAFQMLMPRVICLLLYSTWKYCDGGCVSVHLLCHPISPALCLPSMREALHTIYNLCVFIKRESHRLIVFTSRAVQLTLMLHLIKRFCLCRQQTIYFIWSLLNWLSLGAKTGRCSSRGWLQRGLSVASLQIKVNRRKRNPRVACNLTINTGTHRHTHKKQ